MEDEKWAKYMVLRKGRGKIELNVDHMDSFYHDNEHEANSNSMGIFAIEGYSDTNKILLTFSPSQTKCISIKRNFFSHSQSTQTERR